MLKQKFNPNGLWPRTDEKIEGFLIPFARHAETGQVIRLPSDRLREGDVHYDHAAHKGKLKCPDCDAKIHYNKGNPSRAGDLLKGQPEHFHTNQKQVHDDSCRVRSGQLARIDRENREIDPTKGFLIHLNSFRRQDDLFHLFRGAANDVYQTTEEGRKKLRQEYEERFKGMERIAIRSVADFVDFLRTKSVARIRQSVVAHRGNFIDWDNFFLFKNRREGLQEEKRDMRIRNFVRHLKPGQETPCLIEIDLPKGAYPTRHKKTGRKSLCLKPEGVRDGYMHGTGRPNFILPHIYIENDYMHLDFLQAGHYFVLGYARRQDFPATHRKNKSGNNMTFINIRVDDRAQVAFADVMELAAENRKRSAKTPKALAELTPPLTLG